MQRVHSVLVSARLRLGLASALTLLAMVLAGADGTKWIH